MRIQVLHVYQRRPSAGVYIEPGEYNDGDEALCGVSASYLVENGHAVVIEGNKLAMADGDVFPSDVLSDGESVPTARVRKR